MSEALEADRVTVRDWSVDDAAAALAIYGDPQVSHWLTPAMHRISDVAAMRAVLQAWSEAQASQVPPSGRWAIERRSDGMVVGGLAIRMLPPCEEDFELSWQLRPEAWGQGYATEAGRVLIRWAFTQGIEELLAVARPNNRRALATAGRLGMTWVGETTKYYGIRTQVLRIRPSDLD